MRRAQGAPDFQDVEPGYERIAGAHAAALAALNADAGARRN